MSSKRMLALVVAIVAATPWAAVHAASNDYDIGGGAGRCAYATGKVAGGSAYVIICNDGYGEASGSDTTAPATAAPDIISGEVKVTTTAGTDRRTFKIDTANPGSTQNQNIVKGFVMDPAMNTATLDFVLTGSSTITVNVTLTAKVAAPEVEPYQFTFNSVDENVGLGASAGADSFGNAGLFVSRAATVSGSIRSSTKGGGTLSSASGEMSTGAGTWTCLSASTYDSGFSPCSFF